MANRLTEHTVVRGMLDPDGCERIINWLADSCEDTSMWATAVALLQFPPNGLASDGRGVVTVTGGSNIMIPIICSPLVNAYRDQEQREATHIEAQVGLDCTAFGPLLVRLLRALERGRNTMAVMSSYLCYSAPEARPSDLRDYLVEHTAHLHSQPLWALQLMRVDVPPALHRMAVALHGWVAEALGHRAQAFYASIEGGLVCPDGRPQLFTATKAALERTSAWVLETTKVDVDEGLLIPPNVCFVEAGGHRLYAQVFDMTLCLLHVLLDKSTPPKAGARLNMSAFLAVMPPTICSLVQALVAVPSRPAWWKRAA